MKDARLQVDINDIPEKPPQTGTVFNIWYLKWSGGDGTKHYEKSRFRVDIAEDSGLTKADKSRTSTICLYFARGCCYKGKHCSYLHRLPTTSDYYPPTQDCFGRDKGSNSKVGNLQHYNTTLYVNGLTVNNDTQAVLTRHFSEFGNIDKIKVIANLNCAFITYDNEHAAQFAREAMQRQALDGPEVLGVEWANEDVNPEGQRENKRKLEERTVATVKRLLADVSESPESEPESEPESKPESPQSDPQHKPEVPSMSLFNQQTLNNLAQLNTSNPKVTSKTLDLGYSDSE